MDLQLSINKLSDALQVPLKYENGYISGLSKMVFQPFPGFSMPITVDTRKLFMNEVVGIVFSVAGNLSIMASHFPKTGAVSMFLLDISKIGGMNPEGIIAKTMNLKQAVAAVRPAIVASFIWKDRKWSTLNLPA